MKLICLQSDPRWAALRTQYRWTSTAVRDALGLAYRPDETINGRIRLALGNAAERAILSAWWPQALDAGYTNLQPAALVEHPTERAWATTTDGFCRWQGELVILEIKNRANGQRYIEPGVTDMAERIQCLWHLACVPEAIAVRRIAWTGYDLIDDSIVRSEVEAEIAALESRVRDLSSDDPERAFAAMLATEQALAAIRSSRETWESKPGADSAIDGYLFAKQTAKVATENLRRAEQAMILATGNAECAVTDKYFYSRPYRADGARGPVSVKPKREDNDW